MRKSFLFIAAMLAFVVSCENKNDCVNTDPKCSELPPSDELCEAYFTSWFYDAEAKSCKQISYSGCSFYGFETKDECEDCGCE